MALWLDGQFWGPWIQRVYLDEVENLRQAIVVHMLPALPDAENEAEACQHAAWDKVMSSPSDGSDDPSQYVDWAEEQGLAQYERLRGMRQAVLNMGAVMLWHLFEQQVLSFHHKQVLSIHEERQAQNDSSLHRKLYNLGEFKTRLLEGGIILDEMASWQKLDELRLVANVVKHASGNSARQLNKVRPDLFHPPDLNRLVLEPISSSQPVYVERPASGSDIYVSEKELTNYFEATINFWSEFVITIQQRSAKCQEMQR